MIRFFNLCMVISVLTIGTISKTFGQSCYYNHSLYSAVNLESWSFTPLQYRPTYCKTTNPVTYYQALNQSNFSETPDSTTLQGFPGFVWSIETNSIKNIAISVNGTAYAYFGNGTPPVGTKYNNGAIPIGKLIDFEPYLPSGANIEIIISSAVAQSVTCSVFDYASGKRIVFQTLNLTAGGNTNINFTISNPVMTWTIDGSNNGITNLGNGSASFNPRSFSNGTHQLNYYFNNGNGCEFNTTQLFCTSDTNAIISGVAIPDTVCAGSPIKLKVTGGVNYLWHEKSDTIDTFQNDSEFIPNHYYNLYNLNDPPKIYFNFIVSGCSNSFTVPVVIKPLPAMDYDSTFFYKGNAADSYSCRDSATYSFNPIKLDTSNTYTNTFYYSYRWLHTNNYTRSLTCYKYELDTFMVTANYGCSMQTPINSGNFFPIKPTITPNGIMLVSSGAISYQWYVNDSIISGAIGQLYIPTRPGNYSVEVVNAIGCSSTSLPYKASLSGINEIETLESQISIYPNPNDGNFSLETNTTPGNYLLQIYSIEGKLLQAENLTNNLTNIKTNNLGKGIYFISISNQANILTKKIVIF